MRVDRFLADAIGSLSRSRVKAVMETGHAMVDGAPLTDPSAAVRPGGAYRLKVPPPVPATPLPENIALDVLFEDKHLIVLNKPAGLVVHPAPGNADGTLVNALIAHCGSTLSGIGGELRPGIVHRIDKDTSGLLVVAKTNAAHEGLAKQFADHSIHRVYQAVTAGVPVPASGTVRGAIGRSERDRKKMALVSEGRGKRAVTHYRTLEVLSGAALIECRLETGRTHQVRVHLASIGHALLGDPVYGRAPPSLKPLLARLGFHRQALHAAELGFVHPASGEMVHFRSSTPVDLRTLVVELGGRDG